MAKAVIEYANKLKNIFFKSQETTEDTDIFFYIQHPREMSMQEFFRSYVYRIIDSPPKRISVLNETTHSVSFMFDKKPTDTWVYTFEELFTIFLNRSHPTFCVIKLEVLESNNTIRYQAYKAHSVYKKDIYKCLSLCTIQMNNPKQLLIGDKGLSDAYNLNVTFPEDNHDLHTELESVESLMKTYLFSLPQYRLLHMTGLLK